MVPELVVWGLRLPSHEVFTALGLAAAGGIFYLTARHADRWDRDVARLTVGALVGAAVFSKIGTAWRYVSDADAPTLRGIWIYGGKTVLGGLFGAYIGVLVAKRIIGYRRSTGDLFAPAVAVGIAVGRIGCFLTEAPGTPTSLPWGITPSPVVAAEIPNCPQCLAGVPLHPSFLYEIVFLVLLAGVLARLQPRVSREGDVFKGFLIAYGGFRFIVEFVRGNPELLWGLSGSQVFLLLLSPLTIYWVAERASHARRHQQSTLGAA